MHPCLVYCNCFYRYFSSFYVLCRTFIACLGDILGRKVSFMHLTELTLIDLSMVGLVAMLSGRIA